MPPRTREPASSVCCTSCGASHTTRQRHSGRHHAPPPESPTRRRPGCTLTTDATAVHAQRAFFSSAARIAGHPMLQSSCGAPVAPPAFPDDLAVRARPLRARGTISFNTRLAWACDAAHMPRQQLRPLWVRGYASRPTGVSKSRYTMSSLKVLISSRVSLSSITEEGLSSISASG